MIEDEIVIVEPRSSRVVAVLPKGGARAASRSTSAKPPVALPPARASGWRRRCGSGSAPSCCEPSCRLEQRLDFFLFMPVPRTIQVCDRPAEVVSAAPGCARTAT